MTELLIPEAAIDAALVSRRWESSIPAVFRPLLAPSRYKGAYGGRGGAKSHFFGEHLIKRALRQKGLRAVCVREIQRSLDQSVKRLLEDKIQSMGVGERFRILKSHIEIVGGGIIVFQGMQDHTAESIKSLEGFDIAWVEEAQVLSQRSLDLLRPTIRKSGSEIWFSWNPQFASDPVDAFLRGDITPPSSVLVKTSYKDNPYLPDEFKREIEWDQKRDPARYAHIWLGEYKKASEAQVFKNWRVEEFETAHDASFLFGGDWGFSIDPTVLVRCYFGSADKRTLFVDHEVYEVGCEIEDTPALWDSLTCDGRCPENRALCQRPTHGEARRWPIVGDSARPETISHMKRHGYNKLEPSVKGAKSVEEGVTFLQSYDIVVHPRCQHTIDELTFYSYKTDPLTGAILPVLQDKKNHVIDSLRYAVEQTRREQKQHGGLLF